MVDGESKTLQTLTDVQRLHVCDSTQGRIRDEMASNERNLNMFFFSTFYLLEQRTCGKMVIKRNRVDTNFHVCPLLC